MSIKSKTARQAAYEGLNPHQQQLRYPSHTDERNNFVVQLRHQM